MILKTRQLVCSAAVVLLAAPGGGCADEAGFGNGETTTPAVHCEIGANDFTGLPDTVLQGTDIRDVAEFTPATRTADTYRAEMGGSMLSVEISRQPPRVTLTRQFQEPGTAPQTKRYQNVCIDGARLSGDGVRGRLIEGGLLLLEQSSGVDGIPPDFWIYYARKE